MPHVVLIGLIPETVDVSDPDLPPGTTHAQIAEGIEQGVKLMKERGWDAAFCGIRPDETAEADIARTLAEKPWDVVVIGGGVRIPKKGLQLFERVVNAVHKGAPNAAIAFNTSPPDTPDAAARWL